MVLDTVTIDQIKAKTGLQFNKVKDFVALSEMILKETGRNIGITTLKRLMGNINDTRKAYIFTLDTIALYLGFPSWYDYLGQINRDSDWDYQDDSIYIVDQEIGKTFELKYFNRVVILQVIHHNGQNALKVIDSKNSSLKKGDILIVHRIKKGEILEAEQVIRGTKKGNYKTRSAITSIKVL